MNPNQPKSFVPLNGVFNVRFILFLRHSHNAASFRIVQEGLEATRQSFPGNRCGQIAMKIVEEQDGVFGGQRALEDFFQPGFR